MDLSHRLEFYENHIDLMALLDVDEFSTINEP